MTDVNKIKLVSDRVKQAQSLLLSQFKDKPNILALVDSLVTEVQKLENTLIELQEVRTLDGSYGVWLDEIGKRNKVSRGNYDDNDYKNAIKLAASKRTSSASVDNILRIVALLTNDIDARIDNNYPYLQELYSYLFCLDQSPEGIVALGELFPVNSRVRIIQINELPLMTGTVGQGIGEGLFNSLLYTKNGIVDDPRFITVGQAIIPPPIQTPVFNTSPPFITGDLLIGATLSVSLGLWEGDSPITFTYQWYRNGSVISGATSATYLVDAADTNTNLSCLVVGSNGFSSATAVTDIVTITEEVVVPPVLNSDIGLHPFVVSQVSNAGVTTMTATITFGKDGVVSYTTQSADGFGDTTLPNKPWHGSPATDIGADFTVSYELAGSQGQGNTGLLFDKAPTITYPLSVNQAFTVSINSAEDLYTTLYNFTIRKVSDATVSQTAQTTVTLENLYNGIS